MVAEFVALFVLSIFLSLNLNRIVGEVNHWAHIIQIELMWAGSNVAKGKPIKLTPPADEEAKHEGSYIKLAALIEKKIWFVSLYDSRSLCLWSCSHCLRNLLEGGSNEDIPTSVGVLAWLHNPDVLLAGVFYCIFKFKLTKWLRALRYDMVRLGNDVEQRTNSQTFKVYNPIFKQTKEIFLVTKNATIHQMVVKGFRRIYIVDWRIVLASLWLFIGLKQFV